MNSNLKAKNLTVQSFRGINDEISLDLEDFTIIYGENGMGKSSFVNSLEYLFLQKLGFLSRSTIKKSAYVNEKSTKRDVRIELNLDNDEFIMLEGTRKSHSPAFDDILENPYVKNASFVINRERLLKFIEGTSGNRYKSIMDLLGIKKLDKVQEVLSPAIKSLKDEYNFKVNSYEKDMEELDDLKYSMDMGLQSISRMKEFNDTILKDIEKIKIQNDEDIKKLSELMNKKDDNLKKDIDEINELLNIKNLDLIDSNTDLEEYKRKLYSSDVFNLESKIEEFIKAYDKLEFGVEDDLNTVLKEYENVASDNLKSSRYLIKSLETSLDYIKLTKSDTCPVCNSNIDSFNIIDEITQKISQINSSNDAFKSWQRNLKLLSASLDIEIRNYERLNDMISEINKLANSNIEAIDLAIFSDLKSDLNDFSEFKKHPTDFNSFNFNELYDNVKSAQEKVEKTELNQEKEDYLNIINKLTELNIIKNSDFDVESLNNQIKQREIEIKNKTLEVEQRKRESENLQIQISQYELDVQRLEKYINSYDESLEIVEKQLQTANKTLEIFTETKEEYIDNMLSEIRDDIKYFYDYIHDDDEIRSPDMVVSGAKKIDVNLDSFGEDVDSRSFASEGHLDTLGLCIFLAFNKQFNDLNLIVLDDVLTTVDAEHKERIARLLIEEFEGYQFIITAHNKPWVNLLEDLCVEYGRDNVVYEIEDWSLEEGPVISQR